MLANEEKITLVEAAKLAPGRPHISSLWRHCRKGVKIRGGGRVKLEHIRFGSRIFTSREALDRFGQALADADAQHFDEEEQMPELTAARSRHGGHVRTPAQRQRDIARAERELEAAGV